MPVDISSIILTTHQATGIPSERGLQMLMDSLLKFISEHGETAMIQMAVPAQVDEAPVAALLSQDSIINEGAQN